MHVLGPGDSILQRAREMGVAVPHPLLCGIVLKNKIASFPGEIRLTGKHRLLTGEACMWVDLQTEVPLPNHIDLFVSGLKSLKICAIIVSFEGKIRIFGRLFFFFLWFFLCSFPPRPICTLGIAHFFSGLFACFFLVSYSVLELCLLLMW